MKNINSVRGVYQSYLTSLLFVPSEYRGNKERINIMRAHSVYPLDLGRI